MLKKGMLLIFCTMVLGLSVCVASPENMPEPSEDAEVVPVENTKRYPNYYDDMVEEYIDKVNEEFEAMQTLSTLHSGMKTPRCWRNFCRRWTETLSYLRIC